MRKKSEAMGMLTCTWWHPHPTMSSSASSSAKSTGSVTGTALLWSIVFSERRDGFRVLLYMRFVAFFCCPFGLGGSNPPGLWRGIWRPDCNHLWGPETGALVPQRVIVVVDCISAL